MRASAKHPGPVSSVMQPPVEAQDPVRPARVPPGVDGPAPVSSVTKPGLSPAFYDNDLMTDGPHPAAVRDSSGAERS